MGFENCEVGFGKKINWEMELVPPLLQDSLCTILISCPNKILSKDWTRPPGKLEKM